MGPVDEPAIQNSYSLFPYLEVLQYLSLENFRPRMELKVTQGG